jgi:GDP-L-fucose synthase
MIKKTVVITGGRGFLGSAVFDRLESGLNNYTVIQLGGKRDWDLTQTKYVDTMLAHYKPDIVIHLAARVGGIGANKANPGLFMYENLAMGMNLIESCRKYGGLEKFIMVGTVCSYPKFTPVPFNESNIWNGYPEETNAPYGIAKKALIEMLTAYKNQYDFNSTNLIPVNMYGPRDNFDPAYSHVIPALILKYKRAIKLNLNKVEIWGTGEASREFLYVDDCARAIEKSLEIETGPDPINIGTGSEIRIKDLALLIAEKCGYNGDIIFNADFPDGQPRRCLDTELAKKKLGFGTQTDLDEGLDTTLDWYNNNEERFIDYFNNIQ